MNTQDLYHEFELLEQKLEGANLDMRLSLQPAVSRVVERMRVQGVPVPQRLRRLDASLCEDVIEARFDNMPV